MAFVVGMLMLLWFSTEVKFGISLEAPPNEGAEQVVVFAAIVLPAGFGDIKRHVLSLDSSHSYTVVIGIVSPLE